MTYDYAREIHEAREEAERQYGSTRRIGGSLYHENDVPDEEEL